MSKNDAFDLQDFLPYLLNQAAERSGQEFQRVYKERYGMLRTEWQVLFHLGIYDQMTAKGISERASIHKTKVSRAVQRLEERRFLTRRQDARDRRVEHLELTAAGRAAHSDLQEVAQSYEQRLLDGYSAEEIEQLRGTLQKLAGSKRNGPQD